MAKIEKIKKGTATIYPATIPQAVVDPTSGKSAREELDEKANHGYDSAPKTLKAVDEAKVDKTSIVGETGQGETLVMHQKAVTDELGTKASHGYESSPKTLKEIDDSVSQLAGEVSLLDAVQGAKIKDIENVLSTANLGQSAQLSVSGRKIISLPKNASNGGMSVKMEGLTAENLVTNGDFRNGTTGWISYIGTNLSVGGNNLLVTGSGTNSTVRVGSMLQSANNGDKLYVKVGVRNNSEIGTTFSIMLREGVSSGTIYASISPMALAAGGTIDSSYILTMNQEAPILYLLISNHFENAADSNGSVIEIGFGGVKTLNLTSIFGAGNEPTKEECDAMFADYFEGVKSFEPTGRVRSVDKDGLNPTALYLTAPELRSHGAVKDEIRKGANGYELVKRVGVGTLGSELITNAADREFSSDTGFWTKGAGWTISDGIATKAANNAGALSANLGVKANTWYLISFDKLEGSGSSFRIIAGNGAQILFNENVDNGSYKILIKWNSSTNGILYLSSTSTTTTIIDNISVKEATLVGGEPSDTIVNPIFIGSNVLYTLATPEIIPISYGGVLNSAESGTIYHEPIIADAGVYGTNLPILMQDYPISAIEEIIKHENGVDTYLNVATAIIASDGLSFTHPDLTDGDLVLFTYVFNKESTNGNITATFYDSNVVKIDTVTGKAYKIEDVITNGVLTRTLTEV